MTLSVTPLKQWTGRAEWALLRRGLGLWTFTYAVQHLVVYAWLDMDWDPIMIWHDILQRPFILVGTLALLIMTALAATSFNAAIKALGALKWKRLHFSVHLIALLSLLHFYWMRSGKNDFADAWLFSGMVLGLWMLRWLHAWRISRKTRIS